MSEATQDIKQEIGLFNINPDVTNKILNEVVENPDELKQQETALLEQNPFLDEYINALASIAKDKDAFNLGALAIQRVIRTQAESSHQTLPEITDELAQSTFASLIEGQKKYVPTGYYFEELVARDMDDEPELQQLILELGRQSDSRESIKGGGYLMYKIFKRATEAELINESLNIDEMPSVQDVENYLKSEKDSH